MCSKKNIRRYIRYYFNTIVLLWASQVKNLSAQVEYYKPISFSHNKHEGNTKYMTHFQNMFYYILAFVKRGDYLGF